MVTSLSNPGHSRPRVAGSRSTGVRSKPEAAGNRLVVEHNTPAAHNTAADNTPAVAGNRDTPAQHRTPGTRRLRRAGAPPRERP